MDCLKAQGAGSQAWMHRLPILRHPLATSLSGMAPFLSLLSLPAPLAGTHTSGCLGQYSLWRPTWNVPPPACTTCNSSHL